MNARVLYVIDHQRPGRDYWSKPEAVTTSVSGAGDEAAKELADRFGLADVPVTRQGCRIRLRVWPEPEDVFALLAHDPETTPADGTWTYDPGEGGAA